MNVDTAKRLKEMAQRFSDLRLLIIGDHALDAQWKINPKLGEASDEKPENITIPITDRLWTPGGASNESAVAGSLGVQAYAAGVATTDPYGPFLAKQLEMLGVQTDYFLLTDSLDTSLPKQDRTTNVYAKRWIEEGEQPREDFIRTNRISEATVHRLFQQADSEGVTLEERLRSGFFDAIILNEQITNALTGPEYLKLIGEYVDPSKSVVVIDSRHRGKDYVSSVKKGAYVKSNSFEFANFFGKGRTYTRKGDIVPLDYIKHALDRIQAATEREVIVTRGGEGIVIYDHGQTQIVEPIPFPKGVKTDSCGGGDAVTVGMTMALAAGASPYEAACYGQVLGHITCFYLGVTGVATIRQAEMVLDRLGTRMDKGFVKELLADGNIKYNRIVGSQNFFR